MLKRILFGLVALVVVLLVIVVGALLYLRIPQNASGMAAESVCSAAFVAGRDADNLMEEDVLPASPALTAISIDVNEGEKSVTAKFAGLFSRTASLLPDRGCVLDEDPAPGAQAFTPDPTAGAGQPWPRGNAPLPEAEWDPAIDSAQLNAAVDAAMQGAGDVAGANPRGLAVVQDGKLLVLREAEGFEGTPLHGWSMTKTVGGMLAYKVLTDKGIALSTPVVDAFPSGNAPSWVAEWAQDERKDITVADLFYMRDGLKNREGYGPADPVVQMLYGEQDMSGWAASFPAEEPAGTRWQYLSATSNILAAVARAQFATDEEYWAYPQTALYDELGLTTASLATDTAGTWVSSSYLWAAVPDWARLGQLVLQDGQWDGNAVLPEGWLETASTPALPAGDGAGYGAQSWLLANPVGGECRTTPGIPEDTVSMGGHWGQVVASVPSKDAVVVRLGWTFDSDQFDKCELLGDILSSLPDRN